MKKIPQNTTAYRHIVSPNLIHWEVIYWLYKQMKSRLCSGFFKHRKVQYFNNAIKYSLDQVILLLVGVATIIVYASLHSILKINIHVS